MSAHKLQGKLEFQGLSISIENKKGSRRPWKDTNSNTSGSTKMIYPYGYIKGTLGMDGDAVDVFVGPNKESTAVFVVTQLKKNPDGDFSNKVDEQKVMLGFSSEKEAKQAYMTHYDDPGFFGSIKEFNMDVFKEKLSNMGKKGKIIKNLYIADTSANIHSMDKSFKSKAQQGYMYAAAERGEIPEKTVKEFSDKTKDFSHLPEKVKTKKSVDSKDEGMDKSHIGFDKLQHKIEGEGKSAESAAKIAAAVGKKKYGAKKMEHASATGKPLKEGQKMKKGCTHQEGDQEQCSKCDANEMMKALTTKFLAQAQSHRVAMERVKVELDSDPILETKTIHMIGEIRPFEHPVAPTAHIRTPLQSTMHGAPDFMKSCDSCGYTHKSLATCPRCDSYRAQDKETKPYWRR